MLKPEFSSSDRTCIDIVDKLVVDVFEMTFFIIIWFDEFFVTLFFKAIHALLRTSKTNFRNT